MTTREGPFGPIDQDIGLYSEVSARRDTAYVLGATSIMRLNDVLIEMGAGQYVYSLYKAGKRFPDVVRDLWGENEPVACLALRTLAGDDRYHVRADVAAGMPAYVLEIWEALSSDASLSVRQSLAWNTFTPARYLAKLSNDPEELVRYAVAHNRNTPRDVLLWLGRIDEDNNDQDSSTHVRHRAHATLSGKT